MMEKIKEAEVLQENYITPESIYDKKYTKTTKFLVPTIGINVLNTLVFPFFVNAYLTDVYHENNYDRPIFMLFSINDFRNKNWIKVYEALITSENYVTEYDVGIKDNEFLLMLVFKIPKEFEEDYKNFRLGRYSLFSDKLKEKFPEYTDPRKKQKNIHWQIIHKDEELKRTIEQTYNMDVGALDRIEYKDGTIHSLPAEEIWDKPDKKREYYRFNKIPSK